ncbi:MAG: hypothetical protein K6A82_02690 [Prevotella sp.]|nr:hypothetical protein [Prevotella sp.]
MKTAYKKPYETPVTEIISAEISPVMYETSIPQAGEGEEGGEADAKEGFLDSEELPHYSPWDD